MKEKRRFSFLLRPDERAALQHLARTTDRSQGATLRRLIRQAASERGLWPPDPDVQPHQGPEVHPCPQ